MVMGLLAVSARAQIVQTPEATPATAIAQSSAMPAAEARGGSDYDSAEYWYNLAVSAYEKYESSGSFKDLGDCYYYYANAMYYYYIDAGDSASAKYYYESYMYFAKYYYNLYENQYYQKFEENYNIAVKCYDSYESSGSLKDLGDCYYYYASAAYYYYMYAGDSASAKYYYEYYMSVAKYYYNLYENQYYPKFEENYNIAIKYYDSYIISGKNADIAGFYYYYASAAYYYYMYYGDSDAAKYYYYLYMDSYKYYSSLPDTGGKI
jgi:hypothetical protein